MMSINLTAFTESKLYKSNAIALLIRIKKILIFIFIIIVILYETKKPCMNNIHGIISLILFTSLHSNFLLLFLETSISKPYILFY